jgi:hypothetical protein
MEAAGDKVTGKHFSRRVDEHGSVFAGVKVVHRKNSDWVGLSVRRVLGFGGTLRKFKKMRRRVE